MPSAHQSQTRRKKLEALVLRACTENWCASMDCTVCAGGEFFIACATLIRGEDRTLSVLAKGPLVLTSRPRIPRRLPQREPWTANAQGHLSELAAELPIRTLVRQVVPARLLGFMALLSRYSRDHEAATQNLCRAWVPQLVALLPDGNPLQRELSIVHDLQMPMVPQLLGKVIRALEVEYVPENGLEPAERRIVAA